jgi:hypothetical protein
MLALAGGCDDDFRDFMNHRKRGRERNELESGFGGAPAAAAIAIKPFRA